MAHLRIFRTESPVTVLGPGARAVIWVQGCPFRCPGCIVPDSWDPRAGRSVTIEEVADWVLTRAGIEGITLSGGEPMAQAPGLAALVDRVRERADLGVVCYTGYSHERLTASGTASQRDLLRRVDLLIDGLYARDLHTDRLWRGSSNQRLIPLTDRYRAILESDEPGRDRSAGVEFFLRDNHRVGYAGVPARAGFPDELRARLRTRGVVLSADEEGDR